MKVRSIITLLSVVLALFVMSNVLFIIMETQRGVLLRFGEVVKPDLSPGLHFKIPFVNNVRRFDARVLTVDAQPERFLTLEKKAVVVDSYAKWKVADVAKYYTATSGDENRANGLLAQRVNDGLRNEVAVRTLHEVVSGERDQLMLELREKLDLPPAVSESVFRRMNAEREKEARELRSQGRELAEGIRASADREVTIIKANAYREAEQIRGEGDARATATYADAFNQDREFYAFTRSLRAYQSSFQDKGDIMLLGPESDFFRYLKDSGGGGN